MKKLSPYQLFVNTIAIFIVLLIVAAFTLLAVAGIVAAWRYIF